MYYSCSTDTVNDSRGHLSSPQENHCQQHYDEDDEDDGHYSTSMQHQTTSTATYSADCIMVYQCDFRFDLFFSFSFVLVL